MLYYAFKRDHTIEDFAQSFKNCVICQNVFHSFLTSSSVLKVLYCVDFIILLPCGVTMYMIEKGLNFIIDDM